MISILISILISTFIFIFISLSPTFSCFLIHNSTYTFIFTSILFLHLSVVSYLWRVEVQSTFYAGRHSRKDNSRVPLKTCQSDRKINKCRVFFYIGARVQCPDMKMRVVLSLVQMYSWCDIKQFYRLNKM